MKHLSLSILLSVTMVSCLFAQRKLSTSRPSGYYTYIYKLTDQEAFIAAAQSAAAVKDAFMHTLVDSFYVDRKKPYDKKLPFGHYLYVTPVANNLVYSLEQVGNVNLQFVNNLKDFQFSITGLKGEQISNAKVTIGKNKTVPYDVKAGLYVYRKGIKPNVIMVDHEGVRNYFTFQEQVPWVRSKKRSDDYYYERPIKTKPEDRPKYTGYMVFNKPMFKPLDTVKFKAYVITAKGKAIHNKPVRVELTENENEKSHVLGMIQPYREGGYDYSFVLADSLDLDLDRNYTIVLKEQKGDKWVKMYSGNFRYEDYELKGIHFSVRTDKDVHSPGNPITVYMKAADENDLAVPDGRVEVQAIAGNVKQFYEKKGFIKDSLWTKNITLDPVGETKLVLPDSIFPKADLDFRLYFTFLNSNNEQQTDQKYLSFTLKKEDLKASLKGDSLLFDYLLQGKSAVKKGVLVSYFKNDLKRDSIVVQFPAAVKLDHKIERYSFRTAEGFEKTIALSTLGTDISVSSNQTKDSLQLRVNNPHHVPFWYTVFSDQKVWLKGYATRLDTVMRYNGDKSTRIRINYLWGGQEFSADGAAMYNGKRLDIKLNAPEVIYPGQTVKMQVNVTDAEGRPAQDADVTALAYTSKFKNSSWVDLPYFGKNFTVLKPNGTIGVNPVKLNGNLLLNWQKWGKELGLDTIEYYRFCNPKEMYSIAESTADTAAQIAPFLVKNGSIEPVSVVYIDDIPVFFSQADQLQRYVFRVPAGPHNIKLRSANYIATLDNYVFLKGKKTIVSIVADEKNTQAIVHNAKETLSQEEAGTLNQYMIRIQDTFNEEKAVISTDDQLVLLNPPPNVKRDGELLVGPFSENYLHYSSGKLDQNFLKEAGYSYTFLPGLLKQRSSGNPYLFNTALDNTDRGNTDYRQYPLKKKEIDSIWNEYLDMRSYTTQLFNRYGDYSYNYSYNNNGRIQMKLDTMLAKKMPYVKNILIFKNDQPDFVKIYPGNSAYFNNLEEGLYSMLYLFKDNRYFTVKDVRINAPGQNYFEWSDVAVLPADQLSNNIDQLIKSVKSNNQNDEEITDQITQEFNGKRTSTAVLVKISGRVFDYDTKTTIPQVEVRVKGWKKSTMTDREGRFVLEAPQKGTLVFSYIGYDRAESKINERKLDSIYLRSTRNDLEEVVVAGYGVQKKNKSISYALEGRMAGVDLKEVMMPGAAPSIRIRGSNAIGGGQEPLYILDGVPVSADASKLDPNLIDEMKVLKGAEATAIYGSRAANGVIIITTKAGNKTMNADGELVGQQQTMRTNFSDYAIWQPKLLTDQDGKASFTVKFPDDITSWNTRLIAMNGNKQSGTVETSIRSFKTLSANFVSPQFALNGDSIKVIGKLMNYSPDQKQVVRKFSYNGGELLSGPVNFKNAHIDTISIVAKGKDSLQFEYTLKQDNGYFDGEIRKIPLLQKGVLETKGYFNAFTRDTTVNYQFEPGLGKVTLRAEASVFPILLDEMEKLRNYEYLCNEQLASKLKALLLEKQVRTYLGQDFKNEKATKDIIKKLQANKRPEGTWGWWQNSNSELWISLHVTEALLEAEKQGYTVNLDKAKIQSYLANKLTYSTDGDQLMAVKLLYALDGKAYIKDFVLKAEKQKTSEKQSLFEKLQIMRLKQMAGLDTDVKWLLGIKKETMFGNSYWGEQNNRFWDNSIQNTLLAYQILKAAGKTAEQDPILRYFLEQRKDGQWRNTYESSLILETILPDLLKEKSSAEPVSLVLNQTETVTAFPFTKTMEAQLLSVRKKGRGPIYFTAYQQFNNPNPEKVSKDFTVKSWFEENGRNVVRLKAGKSTKLKVEVEVRADADYVMIEIPIPAGCSYENKVQQYWGVETHREYFKQKTSIFCTKLKKGKYNFEVELMPRYSGNYSLNPAKAEMMYFPVFYGREGMKRVEVK